MILFIFFLEKIRDNNSMLLIGMIQRNLTNPDTIRTVEIVLINGVSSFQGLAVLHFLITQEDDLHITGSYSNRTTQYTVSRRPRSEALGFPINP